MARKHGNDVARLITLSSCLMASTGAIYMVIAVLGIAIMDVFLRLNYIHTRAVYFSVYMLLFMILMIVDMARIVASTLNYRMDARGFQLESILAIIIMFSYLLILTTPWTPRFREINVSDRERLVHEIMSVLLGISMLVLVIHLIAVALSYRGLRKAKIIS